MKSKERDKKNKIFTKELWGLALTLFSAVILFCLFTGNAVFYPVGEYASGLFLGVFGYFAYPLFVFLTFCGIMTVIGKKIASGKSVITALGFSFAFFNAFLIMHLAIFSPNGYALGEYISECFSKGNGGISTSTVGGVAIGAIVYFLNSLLSTAGSFAFFSACVLLGVVISFKDKLFASPQKTEKVLEGDNTHNETAYETPKSFSGNVGEKPIGDKGKLFVSGDSSFEMKNAYSDNKSSFGTSFDGGTYSSAYHNGFASDSEYKKREETVSGNAYGEEYDTSEETVSERYSAESDDIDGFAEEVAIPRNYTEEVGKMEDDFSDGVDGIDEDASDDTYVDSSNFTLDDEPKSDYSRAEEGATFARKPEAIREEPERKSPSAEKPSDDNPFDQMPLNYKYNAPPVDLLKDYETTFNYGEIEMFKQTKGAEILTAIKDLSKIETTIANVVVGPAITRFDIVIPPTCTINNITKYKDDIKLRLKCKNEIRFAPVVGTPYLGLEVPNDRQSTVGLKSIITSDIFNRNEPNTLDFALGKNLYGEAVIGDINDVKHLLVVGATGTGKSVGLNALLISLMYKYSPKDVRFIIVDPKRVEFTPFLGSPHLLFNEIIYDAPKTVSMLEWVVNEMEARYVKFSEAEVRNINEYNAQIDPRKEPKMIRIIVLIDEFADIISSKRKEIENSISSLAAKARAAGIYMILATQRPSANIIEGTIKNNFASRLSYKMSSLVNSQTVFDCSGAEKLLGKGDLLYKFDTMGSIERAQGAFIDTPEVKAVLKYIKEHNECYFNESAQRTIDGDNSDQIESVTAHSADTGVGNANKEYIFSLYFAVLSKEISISHLQRNMGYGFGRSANIIDWMSAKGYVAESEGPGKRRKVLISEEKFMEIYGNDFSLEEYNARIKRGRP